MTSGEFEELNHSSCNRDQACINDYFFEEDVLRAKYHWKVSEINISGANQKIIYYINRYLDRLVH